MKVIIGNVESKILIEPADGSHNIAFIAHLRTYMRERPGGYSYAPAYKDRRWDGYAYFITPGGKFATGFVPMVLNNLRQICPELSITLIDERTNLPKFRGGDELITDLGYGYELRDYQLELVKKITSNVLDFEGVILPHPRGILDAATNAGKSVVMAGLLMNMEHPQALVLIDRKKTFNELKKALSKFWPIGYVNEDGIRLEDITICMAKTLSNAMDRDVNVEAAVRKYSTIIIDEGHKAGSDTFKGILKRLNAGCRIIVSGTPLDMDDKVTRLTLVGLTGKILAKVTNQQMIDAGVSLRPIVTIHRVIDPGIIAAGVNYATQQEALCRSGILAKRVREIIGDQDKYTLVTFRLHDHGEFLYTNLYGREVECEVSDGYDPESDAKMEGFAAGRFGTFIASMILKESVNLPKIQRLIRCEGGRDKITTKQIVGRVLRNDGVNTTVEVHDFYIDGKYTEGHSLERIRHYLAEGFEVQYTYPQRRNGHPI